MPGVIAEGDFYIVVYTESQRREGVHIYYDSSTVNEHSEVTDDRGIAEWDLKTPKAEVNWMIRVEGGGVGEVV